MFRSPRNRGSSLSFIRYLILSRKYETLFLLLLLDGVRGDRQSPRTGAHVAPHDAGGRNNRILAQTPQPRGTPGTFHGETGPAPSAAWNGGGCRRQSSRRAEPQPRAGGLLPPQRSAAVRRGAAKGERGPQDAPGGAKPEFKRVGKEATPLYLD